LRSLVLLHATRRQYFGTFFLRNRPLLDLVRRLTEQRPKGSSLRIAVLGCSIGADVYSIVWTIRSARPDLKVLVRALDLSKDILNVAEKGVYAPNTCELVGASIFERLTPHEKAEMFDWEGDQATVKPWLREAITWEQGDASDPELIHILGRQDIVVANNFLCHMNPAAAQNCLRNIAGLVDRGGYLITSGVDLDVRTTVARELGWRPVPELIEEIHEGDPELRQAWPCHWWGLEPLNKKRADWQMRYAAVFRLTGPLADSRQAAPRVAQHP
jgi:SAM-dependent methyltransferase